MPQVKSIFRYLTNQHNQEQFKQSRCLITISVGQQTHEGERFRATINLLNESFNSFIMLIGDSLQRYTMALAYSNPADTFYETSIKEGDLWLERNKKHYNELNSLKKIMRWDIWLQHQNFTETQNKILALIKKDPTYKAAFDDSINEFITKYRARLTDPTKFNIERARQLGFNFILEECTALCLWTELGCHFEVYPHLHNTAIQETWRHFVEPYYPHLLHAITIGFRYAKSLKPQKFLCLEQEQHCPENTIKEIMT